MSRPTSSLFLSLFIAAVALGPADARDARPPSKVPSVRASRHYSSLADSQAIPWPTRWASLQTDKITAALGSNGTLGLPFSDFQFDYPFWSRSGFETPPGSGFNYLYGASIWIGGIVNGDTLVSTGDDGWLNIHEFYPDHYLSTDSGWIRPESADADLSLRVSFSDTLQTGVPDAGQLVGDPHRPLNLSVISRSYTWLQPPYDNSLVFDITIRNTGRDKISAAYVGIYVDGDVTGADGGLDGSQDDITGSVRNRGIGYIIDNDGNPKNGAFDPATSPTGMIGMRFLASSFPPTDSGFNWWINQASSRGKEDFGPQKRVNAHTFQTGASGQPMTDPERYYLLSNREWDYDQVQMPAIGSSDPVWQPVPAAADTLCQGADVRFLMSLGPFDLPPDSSVRVLYSFFTADSVHVDPNIMDFLPLAPDLYTLSLDFRHVARNASAGDTLEARILNPENPPSNVTLRLTLPDDPLLTWDPWCFNNIDGFNVCCLAIPDSAYVHPGAIPVWLQPALSDSIASTGRTDSFSITGLVSQSSYALSVGTRFAGQNGRLSRPVFTSPTRPDPPQLGDTVIFVRPGKTAQFRWTPSNSLPDHYNVYRFSDSESAEARHLPYYTEHRLQFPPVDSVVKNGITYYYYALTAYAEVNSAQIEFSDSAAVDGNEYFLTAVNSHGFESPFAGPVKIVRPVRTRDILLLTNANPTMNFVSFDTIRACYDSVLQGFDYAMYNLADSQKLPACAPSGAACFDGAVLMPYRLVIIDDGIGDGVLSHDIEGHSQAFSRYIRSGGTLVYFGSLSRLTVPQFDIESSPVSLSVRGTPVADLMGIDSVHYIGPFYFERHEVPPFVDTLSAFEQALTATAGSPGISVDTAGYQFGSRLPRYWPPGTPPSVSTFVPSPRSTVTHRFQSSLPGNSLFQGEPVGVSSITDSTRTYAFGFHLWYMHRSEARQLISWIIGSQISPRADSSSAPTPSATRLLQNYPNPFNPETRIRFDLPAPGRARLEIYNLLGQKVRTLVDQDRPAGQFQVVWDGTGDDRRSVASGIYFCRLETPAGVYSRKMLLLR